MCKFVFLVMIHLNRIIRKNFTSHEVLYDVEFCYHLFQNNCRGRHGSYSTPNSPTGQNVALHVRKVDSATIANLDKDCFIIPIAYLDRFLPDGVNVRNNFML